MSKSLGTGRSIIIYFFLLASSLILMIPLIWMVSTSLKTNLDAMAYPIVWIPEILRWENYTELFAYVPFGRFIWNSTYISMLSVVGTVLSSAIVAYGFARMDGIGKRILFMVLLSTMMLPGEVTLIPHFLIFKWLGWINTSLPLWVPKWFASAFFVFMLRQFMMTLPKEVEDAARIDGCNTFQIFSRIVMPMLVPALITVAVLNFFGSWNDFLGPLIYLQDLNKFTLAIALNLFKTQYTMFWNLTMAASVISIVPCIIIFFFAQKYIVRGFVVSSLKG